MDERSQVAKERCPHLSTLIPDLWEILSEQEREQLLIWSSFYIFKKGEVIFESKWIPQNCFILAQGQVKICRDGYSDRTQIIRMIKPVEFFGYHAFFASHAYSSNAVAVDDSTLCLIPIHILEDIISNNPKVAIYFIQDLSKKLGEADKRTISLTQKHTRGRLAESIIILKEKYGLEQDGATISIYLSRQELADLSNMTTSNAIRTLYAFEEERVLAIDGRKIKILNEKQLLEISRLG